MGSALLVLVRFSFTAGANSSSRFQRDWLSLPSASISEPLQSEPPSSPPRSHLSAARFAVGLFDCFPGERFVQTLNKLEEPSLACRLQGAAHKRFSSHSHMHGGTIYYMCHTGSLPFKQTGLPHLLSCPGRRPEQLARFIFLVGLPIENSSPYSNKAEGIDAQSYVSLS